MNKKTDINFIFILSACLFNLVVISSSYADVQPDSTTPLNPDELSLCMEDEKSLNLRAEQLKEQFSQLTIRKNKISQLDQSRNEEYADIDFHNELSVNEYNQLNNELNQLSKNYTADTETFNNAVRQYKAGSVQLMNKCDNKKFHK